MMDRPLLISSILDHAALQWPHKTVASREADGSKHRCTFAELAVRVRQLANALKSLRLSESATVATIASNGFRHQEAYYAVSGSGLILHTCNPRLHIDQLCYVINHAEDEVVLFESHFASIVAAVAARCPRVRAWICCSHQKTTPSISGLSVLCYEDFVADQPCEFEWPTLNESAAAALCYTSGTTGVPKGALFSHRSIVLNVLTISNPGILCISPRECIMPIVPMIRVNGWCMPYAALMSGAKLVLPGPKLDAANLYDLMQTEGVTCSAAVPTIWLQLMQHIEQHGLKFSSLQRIMSGGAAMTPTLIGKYMDEYGVDVRHGWGMTETVAVASVNVLDEERLELPSEERTAILARQGKSVFGIEIAVFDADGQQLPRDGQSQGELMIRGQWIVSGYYKQEESPLRGGWLPTGDVATIDPLEVMQIRDRSKDLIKSGGEWIISLDLENVAAGHPSVGAAAVIAVPHPVWQERPVIFVVLKPGRECEGAQIIDYLSARFARLWIPDQVIFVDELPIGATGKVQKSQLRERYRKLRIS